MRVRLSMLIVGPALAAASCVGVELAPAPESVVPAWGFNGEDTPVVILGEDFLPALDVGAGGSAERDTTFSVTLVDGDRSMVLPAVTWQDRSQLGALVPAGLQAGTYDVLVTDPTGRTGRADDVFEVRDTRVDAIRLEVDRVVQEVFEDTIVSLALVDPSGRPVTQDLDVAIRFTGSDGEAAAISWDAVDMEAVRVREGGLDAGLGQDGIGALRIRGQQPDTVTITASPVDTSERARGDDVTVQFTRASELQALVQLPATPFRGVAGVPFDVDIELRDAFGNPAPDAVVDVVIAESCGGFRETRQIRGAQTVSLTPQRATERVGCASNRVEVSGTVSGESEAFGVDPGPAAALFVLVNDTEIVAGEPLNVTVVAYDAYGNVRGYAGRIVQVLDGAAAPDQVSCAPQGSGAFVSCSVRITRAGPSRTLTLVGEDGLEGESDPYVVVPGPVREVLVTPAEAVWEAGVPVLVGLSLVDAYGNPIGDPEPDATTLGDDDGSTVCAHEAGGTWTCVRTLVGTEEALVATAAGVSGSASFDVVNGPLASLSLQASAGQVVAGGTVGVSIQALDAWGNPWVVQEADPLLSLESSLGGLSPGEVALDGDGRAEVSVGLTRAGQNQITAKHASGPTSAAAAVLVTAGTSASLRIVTARPWAATDTPTSVRVESEDAWGNRTSLGGAATVSSSNAGFAPVGLSMVNGVGVTSVTWLSAVGTETVRVQGPMGIQGTKPMLIHRPCASGPLGRLEIEGDAFDRSCVDGGTALATASFAGSSALGSASLVGFAVSGPDGDVVTDVPEPVIEANAAGIYEVAGLVLQDDGCATEVADTWFVGEGPGHPAGRVAVQAARTTLDLGDPDPTTTVTIQGVGDCLGDPISGGQVRVTTDLGRVIDAVPSGRGLMATTDAQGLAVATLDLSAVERGSTTTVRVGGVAPVRGSVVLQVTGDDQPPEVREQTPKGAFTGSVSTIEVRFSEPMDPAMLVPTAFSVTGPTPVNVVFVLKPDPQRVQLVLDPALFVDENGYTLRIAPTVKDVAGNALAGTWGAAGVPYLGRMGIDADVAPVSSCVPDLARFRPDGDDGAGIEADAVEISIESASSPAWWVATVRNESGAMVRQTWIVPEGAEDVWIWDGRNDQGRVVPSGTYAVSIDAEGNEGNRGGACSASVTVLP